MLNGVGKKDEDVNCTDSGHSGYNTCNRVAYNCGNMVDWKTRGRKDTRMVVGNMKNKEGYPDPTATKAINGVRREERIRELERKYDVKRGDVITIEERIKREDGRTRSSVRRKMQVVGLYSNFILLRNKYGYNESFQWYRFLQIRR